MLTKVDHLGSQQTAVPTIQYHPGQTSTTTSTGIVNANVYNNAGGAAYGSANYSGTATTTSPGTYSTQMIPVTVEKYAWGATFWRKSGPMIFGAILGPLSDELRQKLQRNTGVVIRIVVDNTPAFFANILPGDVLVSIADDQVSETTFTEVSRRHAGKKVDVRLRACAKIQYVE